MSTTNLKGRNTIRAGRFVTDAATGQTSRMIKRWRFEPKPDTTLARLEVAYLSSLDAVDRVEARAASNKTGGKFTRDGARDDVLNFALNSLIPDLHKARLTIKRAKAEVAERRSKLKIEGPDPSDIAAAFRRMEIRTFLREKKSEDRVKYFLSHDDNLPADVAMAVLELPPEYSGVTATQHERLTNVALAARHGTEIAETAELEEAISVAESVIELSRDELRLEVGGIDKQRWDELAAAIEARFSAPWLRRRGGEVHVVDLERRVERKPTPEELNTGIFATDHAEYLKVQCTPTSACPDDVQG
jgi:hypothetical protein